MEDLQRITHMLLNFRSSMGCNNKIELLAKGEIATLHIIKYLGDKASPKRLVQALDMSSGRIGNILTSLERQELIKRIDDPEDIRKTIITLTKSGEEKIDRFDQDVSSEINKVKEEMGEERFLSLLSLLDEMIASIKNIKEKEDVKTR